MFVTRQMKKFCVTFAKNDARFQTRKNVSFNDYQNYDLNASKDTFDDKIQISLMPTRTIQNSSTMNSSFDMNQSPFRTGAIDCRDIDKDSESLNELKVSNNINKKKSHIDGYEILVINLNHLICNISKLTLFLNKKKTIKAKLKQRVNQNRTKNVTLGDIDSIMKNVVTVIQDEFIKRFPSGPPSSSVNN